MKHWTSSVTCDFYNRWIAWKVQVIGHQRQEKEMKRRQSGCWAAPVEAPSPGGEEHWPNWGNFSGTRRSNIPFHHKSKNIHSNCDGLWLSLEKSSSSLLLLPLASQALLFDFSISLLFNLAPVTVNWMILFGGECDCWWLFLGARYRIQPQKIQWNIIKYSTQCCALLHFVKTIVNLLIRMNWNIFLYPEKMKWKFTIRRSVCVVEICWKIEQHNTDEMTFIRFGVDWQLICRNFNISTRPSPGKFIPLNWLKNV